jgi:septum formation protein
MMTLTPPEHSPSDAIPGRRTLSRPLVLASGSPRRRELLASLNLDFSVVVPPVDESAFDLTHLDPPALVRFLARVKAQEVFKHRTDAFVVGADTVVALDGEVFGKPRDEEDAHRMLSALQGRWHEVHSGITVFNPETSPPALSSQSPPFLSEARSTRVYMRPLSPEAVRAYVATGEPMDKAGAYAIQGYGAALIERIDGCYFNVVGMSLHLLNDLFAQLGEPLIF